MEGVPTEEASEILERVTVKVSEDSTEASSVVETVMVWVVTPGEKVRVPETAV